MKYLLIHPASDRLLLGGSSDTKEPNRREAVLGFSLQHDTYCWRVQLGLLKTSLQQRSPGLILRQLPYGSFQQTAATASFFFCVLGSFHLHCYDDSGKNCIQVLLASRFRKRSRFFVRRAKELSVSLYIEEKKIILMIQGKIRWSCPFPFLHINYKS